MIRYIIVIDQQFPYVNNTILEWIIQNSIQLAYERVPRTTLKYDIVRNFELIKIKIINKLSNFNDISKFEVYLYNCLFY